MPHNLTNPITLTNAARLVVGRPELIDDDQGIMVIPVELRTTAANNVAIARVLLQVRNGRSDKLLRGSLLTNTEAGALLAVDSLSLTTPTGFDQCYTAFKGGVGAAASRVALEGVLRTLGVFDSVSLAGS